MIDTDPVRTDAAGGPRRLRWVLALWPLLAAGCPGITGDNTPGPATDALEPNGSFAAASKVAFNIDRRATLTGSVQATSAFQGPDLDVFDLGALRAGDRLILDASTPDSPLDVSIAVFDERGRLVIANDDRESGSRRLDSYVDVIVRHDSDPYFVVVTRSSFATSGQGTGRYSVDVRITQGTAAPAPRTQVLLLNWEGGRITSPSLGTTSVAPFDAGLIDGVYEGQTETLKTLIVETMEENFERFAVTIYTTDSPPPPGIMYSTVHFGSFDQGAFGIAENVDAYNFDRCDDAIIFTESFRPRVFSSTPNVADLALAIGNVAAHEVGHLLGLNHVDDEADLMDAVSPADSFIQDQDFMESVLSDDIMPIGTQDAVLLLSEIVGFRGS